MHTIFYLVVEIGDIRRLLYLKHDVLYFKLKEGVVDWFIHFEMVYNFSVAHKRPHT